MGRFCALRAAFNLVISLYTPAVRVSRNGKTHPFKGMWASLFIVVQIRRRGNTRRFFEFHGEIFVIVVPRLLRYLFERKVTRGDQPDRVLDAQVDQELLRRRSVLPTKQFAEVHLAHKRSRRDLPHRQMSVAKMLFQIRNRLCNF